MVGTSWGAPPRSESQPRSRRSPEATEASTFLFLQGTGSVGIPQSPTNCCRVAFAIEAFYTKFEFFLFQVVSDCVSALYELHKRRATLTRMKTSARLNIGHL